MVKNYVGSYPPPKKTIRPIYIAILVIQLLFLNTIANSQTIYVGLPGYGVWKSMDDSYTWFSVNDNLPDLSVEYLSGIKYLLNGDIRYDLYASVNSGVYRTTDGGITWNLIFNELPYAGRVKVDPTDARTIYVGHHLLYRSTDYGNTWIDITPPADAGHGMAFDIAPEDRNVIYAFGINT